MSYQTIELTVEGGHAHLTLRRPEVRNAFNAQMIHEITDACAELQHRDDVRLVLLRGAGPMFSAGADVNWMRQSLEFSSAENERDARRMSDMFKALDTLPQPVVGAVHGAALGGGMGLVACCDIVVSEPDVTFGFTESRLGIIPAVISAVVLPKIGPGWARALFTTGERFGADVAARIGLVHWVAESGGLDVLVADKVRALEVSGPVAVREAKALVRSGSELDPEIFRGYTAERIAELRASPEGQEGLRAFLEKRRPAWRVDG